MGEGGTSAVFVVWVIAILMVFWWNKWCRHHAVKVFSCISSEGRQAWCIVSQLWWWGETLFSIVYTVASLPMTLSTKSMVG